MGNALVSMAGVRRSSTLRAGLLQFGRIDWVQHGLATDSRQTIDAVGGSGALTVAGAITVGEGKKGSTAAPAVSPRRVATAEA